VSPIKGKSESLGAVIIFSDISEKKKNREHQLRSSQLAALGELAAGMAHEINNPINGIINYAQLLLNTQDQNDHAGNILQRIIKEGNRIAAIVQNLLHFAHQGLTEQGPLDVQRIIAEPLNLFKQNLMKDGIGLEIDIEENLPEIFGNLMRLEQVVLNMLSNARHALNRKFPEHHPDKILQIAIEPVEINGRSWAQISFRDQGCGIPAENFDKIFNPFFTTKEAGVGTGLGLSVSNEIVVEHGGQIDIESELDQFTRVILRFPAMVETVTE
jgi:two-component system NtrC family sensor kinase